MVEDNFFKHPYFNSIFKYEYYVDYYNVDVKIEELYMLQNTKLKLVPLLASYKRKISPLNYHWQKHNIRGIFFNLNKLVGARWWYIIWHYCAQPDHFCFSRFSAPHKIIIHNLSFHFYGKVYLKKSKISENMHSSFSFRHISFTAFSNGENTLDIMCLSI